MGLPIPLWNKINKFRASEKVKTKRAYIILLFDIHDKSNNNSYAEKQYGY